MNPAEALQAHLDLGAPPIDEPVRALDEACRANDVFRTQFQILDAGESLRVL